MEKFLNVPVYNLITSGTSVTPVGSADLTDTGNLFANVSVGDIVHQSTDNEYFTVASKIDDNNLTLTALDGGTTPIVSGKAFFIHSATAFNSQLVSCDNIGLIEQATTSNVKITYDGPSNADVIGLVHTPVASGSEAVRDLVEDAVVTALATHWKEVAVDMNVLPFKVIGISIG
jgi:hypothetical protein|tara:strand:- start:537 stop:1058 length:522 start_codon:yes stop_codon:yes gene_type:complete